MAVWHFPPSITQAADAPPYDEISKMIEEGHTEEAQDRITLYADDAVAKKDDETCFRLSVLSTESSLKDTDASNTLFGFMATKKYYDRLWKKLKETHRARYVQLRNRVALQTCATFFDQMAMTDRGSTEYPVILVDQFYGMVKNDIDNRTFLAGAVARSRIRLARGEPERALETLEEVDPVVRGIVRDHRDDILHDTYLSHGLEQYYLSRIMSHLHDQDIKEAEKDRQGLFALPEIFTGGIEYQRKYADWFDSESSRQKRQKELRDVYEPLINKAASALVAGNLRVLHGMIAPESPLSGQLTSFFEQYKYKKWSCRIVRIDADTQPRSGSRTRIAVWAVSEMEFRHGDVSQDIDFNGEDVHRTTTETVSTYDNAGMQLIIFQFDGKEWKLESI